MQFRLKAFRLHLLASGAVLTLVLGGLHLGWYRWPGWYLADAASVTRLLACVDLIVGPLLTLVIASPTKPRRVLARDVTIIGAVQLIALFYGSVQLWNGRPLYYAFSVDELQMVQAYDIEPGETELARQMKSPLRAHWYSLPRWVWAPLPEDPQEQKKIVESAVSGGSDVIAMPRYYRSWESGLPQLRSQLKKVDEVKYFSGNERKLLKQKERAAGIDADQANAMAMTGRGRPLLAIFDPATLKIIAMLQAD